MATTEQYVELAGKRILVIRPRLQSVPGPDNFIDRLLACGAEPLHLPVVAIEPYSLELSFAEPSSPESPLTESSSTESPSMERSPAERIKSQIVNLANMDMVIVTSRPAAATGARWINHYWPQLPPGLAFYAVGDGTRQILAQQGIHARIPQTTATSEGLLELPPLQQVRNHKVMILKGEGGRQLLESGLQQRGAQVHTVELYRRCPCSAYGAEINEALEVQASLAQDSEAEAKPLTAVVAHSQELLHSLLQQVDKANLPGLHHLPLVVPSQRVAQWAQQQGFRNPVIARSALPDDMVSALSRCYS